MLNVSTLILLSSAKSVIFLAFTHPTSISITNSFINQICQIQRFVVSYVNLKQTLPVQLNYTNLYITPKKVNNIIVLSVTIRHLKYAALNFRQGFKICHFNRHIFIHTDEKRIFCLHCPLSFKTFDILCAHLKLIHPDSIINCKKCDFSSFFTTAINEHNEQFHSQQSSDTICCQMCTFVANSTHSLVLHQTIHNTNNGDQYHCPECEYQTCNKNKFNSHITVHSTDKPYNCIHCATAFKAFRGLYTHIKHFHPRSSIKCEFCNYTSFFPPAMTNHINQNHTQKESNVICCEACKFKANSSSSLALHRTVHTTKKGAQYQCTECDYKTSRTSSFNSHIFVHTKDKPYVCPHCILCFRTNSSVCKHMKQTHPDSVIKCEHCNFSSFFAPAMDSHIKQIHSRK